MAYTLTYSENAKGWPSFYSFIPEKMIGMNNVFYSFKNGSLYKHNSNSSPRNNFYGDQYESTLSGVINIEPTTIKKFKTISLEGNAAWDCSVYSDLEAGYIDKDWFSLKEGEQYAYIRRRADDDTFEARSAQGVGSVSTVDSSVITSVILTFTFNIDSMISVGDKLYGVNSGTPEFAGTITAVSGTTITIDSSAPGAIVPVNGQFIMYVKNNIAESYGATGYYLAYTLTNDSTSFVELYGIASNLFKSFP
jgi:hypothetical protein